MAEVDDGREPESIRPDLFDGLRVIELGQYVAAPYCAELFAHGGAEVLSIEPPAGTPTRFSPPGAPDGIQYVSKARGKRSIALALNHDEGRRIALELCLTADVVISNMRPGSAERLGLGYAALAELKPSIIVAEVDGFGDHDGDDPKACVDIVAQGASGLLASLALDTEPRVRRDVLLTDVAAGMLLAFGVSSALWHRERTGRGQRVTTSLMGAALALQLRTAHIAGAGDAELMDTVQARQEGAPFEEVLARHNAATNRMYPTYDVFATADGWLAVGGVRHNGHVLYELAGIDSTAVDSDGRSLTEQLGERLRTLDAATVTAHLEAAGVPVGPVRLLEEVLTDPDQVARGHVDDFDHERLGRLRLPAAPVHFSGSTYAARRTTPTLGEHTVDELRRLGYDMSAIERLDAAGVVLTAPSTGNPPAGAGTQGGTNG